MCGRPPIGSMSDAEADTIYKEVTVHFTVKPLEAARFILHGIEIFKRKKKVDVKTKPIYIEIGLEITTKWIYAVHNPICADRDLTPSESHPALKYSTSYLRVVGSLPYIANASRPDISYAMS